MGISKDILAYVRPMILVFLIILGGLTIIASTGNQPKNYVWVKPNATDQDYRRDNYACLRESQQRVSEYSREGRSANASSEMQKNDSLYNACMQARGWSLEEAGAREEKAAAKIATMKAKKVANKVKKRTHEVQRDKRFIAYDNGTVLDTETNLMWAAKDNGVDINWEDAKNYCDRYASGGYIDWRMPTHDELATLFDANKTRPNPRFPKKSIHIATKLIDISSERIWDSGRVEGVLLFNFDKGEKENNLKFISSTFRALPVRDE